MHTIPWVVGCVAALVAALLVRSYIALWLQATVSRAGISMLSLIMMSLRNVSPRAIVECKVMAVQAGLPVHSTKDLESHYLAGGDIYKVTRALIVANRADIELDWRTAAAVDLAGRDILEAVQTSVYPKVIDCPTIEQGKRSTVSGVAKDGIQLNVRVRVTVRTNLKQLIGGATETTIVARVGQGIVSAIGACANYREALTKPMVIAAEVLRRGLDAQTAFAIVSIDIEEIVVGMNIGARLQLEQAEADMRIAQANAETRLAMAVALEREMQALLQENRASLVFAEAGIPLAIAEAYETGQLSMLPKLRGSASPRKNTIRIGA